MLNVTDEERMAAEKRRKPVFEALRKKRFLADQMFNDIFGVCEAVQELVEVEDIEEEME